MTVIPFAPATHSNGVTVCTNLRTSLSGDSLVQAAPPAQYIDGGLTPLLNLDSEGTRILVADGCRVSVVRGTTVTHIGTASAPVTSALSDGSTLITVMTLNGPEYLAVNGGEYTWLGIKPIFPEVRFIAEMKGPLSGTVSPHLFNSINLSAESPSIGQDEVAEYSTCLTDTYSGLSAMATAGGRWVQPVMVRAYYMDSAGRVIHACSPVIVGPIRGWQGTDPITVTFTRHSDTAATLNSWQMSLETYVINMKTRLEAIPSPWQRIVARIMVCISPQLHPLGLDKSSIMAWRINNAHGGNPSLTLALPGATSNLTSLDRYRLDEMAEFAARMLPSADELNLTDYYASFSGGDHTLTPLYSITPGEERAQLEAIRKKTRTSSVDMRMAELCTPHCFSASCGLQSGMWQIWGNLTPHLFPGLRPCDLGVSDDDMAEDATSEVTVIDTDGERHILSSHSSMPQFLSPMLLYPHTGATKLTLSVRNAAGTILTRVFDLRPVPGTSWSIALNSNLAVMSPDTFPISSSSSAAIPNPGSESVYIPASPREDAVVITSRRSWTSPVSSTTCGHGAVTAITPAYRAGTITDTAKARLSMFTTSGIYTATVNSRGIIDNPMKIDPRPILSHRHVAYTPDGVYAAGASELVRVRGNTSVTMLRDFRADTMAWHPTLNELWYTDILGNLHFLSFDAWRSSTGKSPVFYDSTLPIPFQPVVLTTLGAKLWITGATQLTQAPDSNIAVSDDSYIEWQGRYCFTGAELPRRITVAMSAVNFTGNIELSIDWGETVFPIMTLAIDGSVEAPVVQPLFLPHTPWNRLLTHPYFTLRINGTATGLRLNSILLE